MPVTSVFPLNKPTKTKTAPNGSISQRAKAGLFWVCVRIKVLLFWV
jgi:hypothetical protein